MYLQLIWKGIRLIITDKICIVCGTNTTVGQWYRGPKCASCYHKKHYLSPHRKFGAKQKFQRGKGTAKRRQIPFILTFDEYLKIISSGCRYCGKDLYKETGHSLDRLDGNCGYESLNLVPCCGDCNTIKNSILTETETVEVVKFIKQLRNKTGSPWE